MGAKGQRRKLAAVFSSPFMLAVGLIAKCAISLISTLKQTPRQAGEELFARSYILWHQSLFRQGGGVVGAWVSWGGGGGAYSSNAFSHASLSALLSSTYHIIFRCGRVNSGACSSHAALLKHFSSSGRAVMIGGLSLLFHSKVVLLVNMRPGELCRPFHSHSLCYSPALLLGLPKS